MNDELEVNQNSRYIHEIYDDKEELEMLETDFVNIADTLDNWLNGDEKIDPDICRYMGMLFLSLANKLEPEEP
ncbi:hypothetical protein HX127_17030 [Acinetobacter sp. 256-1]|uniref:hypothetical protein n=1 Tax=Acinetobacter sp. 256-1 TaxID=2746721 RepID=UPI0025789FD9|nr:hypothetical protein [Acinetobacter sp. 256-1]MDM1759228.1 hypothetical protein [Acinetobacter sp. 256-1]